MPGCFFQASASSMCTAGWKAGSCSSPSHVPQTTDWKVYHEAVRGGDFCSGGFSEEICWMDGVLEGHLLTLMAPSLSQGRESASNRRFLWSSSVLHSGRSKQHPADSCRKQPLSAPTRRWQQQHE